MEATLESRIDSFREKYQIRINDSATTVTLDEVGEHHLLSLLDDLGWSEKAKTGIYRKISGTGNQNKIELFELWDIKTNQKGFSYLKPDSLNEMETYWRERNQRLMTRTTVGNEIPGCIGVGGGLIGGLCDVLVGIAIVGAGISAWWLVAPPLVCGRIGALIGKSYNDVAKADYKREQKAIDGFLEKYKDRLKTGKEALLEVLSKYSE